MILEIHVTFTAGHFHGAEWPPSPARLFQALVAATHHGAHGLLHTEVRDRALEWLEALPLPEIVAINTETSRELLTNYVPNNDDGDKRDFREHIKTAKSLRVHPLPPECRVTYRWKFEPGDGAEKHADAVAAMASLVTYLGRTVDLVYARGDVCAKLSVRSRDDRKVWPARETPGGAWLAPKPGFLKLCQQRHPRSVTAMPPDFTNSRQVDYSGSETSRDDAPLAVLEFFRPDGRRMGFDPRRIREPAGMVRDAFNRWLAGNPRMAAHYGADRVARLLLGHRRAGESAPSEGGHFATVPLPSINPGGTADGWLRRILIIGWGIQDSGDRALFADLVRGLDGMDLHDRGHPVGRLQMVPDRLQTSLLAPWMNNRGEPARVWRSITPVVLSGYARRGRSLEACLARTLAQQGFPAETVESVATFAGPLVPTSTAARDYRVQGYLSTTRRVHAEVIFRKPVSGPLIVGRGRFAGLGLFLPAD
jgi:CRISPR-associated protein Csb2